MECDLARLGAGLLVSTTDALADGHVIEVSQEESAATYAHRLTKDDGLVDWTQPAAHLHNLIRGLHPWPRAFSFLNTRRVILHRSTVVARANATPGAVIEAQGDRLTIAAGRDALGILEIQGEGTRPMTVREFLAGHHVAAGDRFTSQP